MTPSRVTIALLPVALAAVEVLSPRPLAAQAAVAMVQVVPDTLVLRVGERGLLSVQPRDRHGSVIPGLRTGWLSRDTTVAQVDGKGYVTGIRVGAAVVAALVGGREGRAIIVVRRASPNAAPPASNLH